MAEALVLQSKKSVWPRRPAGSMHSTPKLRDECQASLW